MKTAREAYEEQRKAAQEAREARETNTKPATHATKSADTDAELEAAEARVRELLAQRANRAQ
ncbi:hypothetical protein DRW03_06335 [Corallococcus sp. H22C18031201]|nr:hypothetical protein DRW03_06335 [Corallococcus sp. H22C18031201]